MFNGQSHFFHIQASRSAVLLLSVYCEGAACLCSNATSVKLSQSEVIFLIFNLFLFFKIICFYFYLFLLLSASCNFVTDLSMKGLNPWLYL